ncbi:peptidase M24 [Acuticoccus sediminis]|uniref:Peptidase M24 n=1 Tax=Acuticoccus sediminis TaxID=2184697 RepID=A0A8B2P5J2_9HYPH|nr:Xaa-Pro peptidase family protein [Acuticoccus sediminis]RAI03849.1 peptidase M24 [Acuticoccus sediminis]
MDHTFGEAEFAARTARIQAAMAREGLAALLLTAEHDVRYVTGYLTRFWESPTRPWFVVLPASGKPIAVIPTIGEALMRTTWVDDIRTWPSPRPDDDGVSLLADTLAAVCGPDGALGVPMGPECTLRMPLRDFEAVRARLAPRRVRDATALLQGVQMVKSPAEIGRIAAMCEAAGRAFDRVPEIAAEGVPLSTVFRRFQIALLEEGADWVPYVAGGAGADGYADVISPATEEPLAHGDLLMLDTGAMRAGYFCDFDRNFAVCSASAAMRSGYHLLHDAVEAGFAAARPGAAAADVFEAMLRVVARAGDAGSVGRLGHGLGMRLTEPPSLTAADTTALAPGMVITLEPGLQLAPGRMMVHEENIVIEPAGPRYLTRRAPAELPVLEGRP